MKRKSLLERFEEKIYYGLDGCWYWTSDLLNRGHGRISVNGKPKLAHRVSYELYKNVDPGSLMVCHTCDNRACVNPDHLWLGTALDNNRDMMNKNRYIRVVGERVGNSKLKNEDIIKIRSLYANDHFRIKDLAKMFDCSTSTIYRIRTKQLWAHI